MGDILIGNPVDHPDIVCVEKLDELLRRGREANGQQNIQFIDDRQHDNKMQTKDNGTKGSRYDRGKSRATRRLQAP